MDAEPVNYVTAQIAMAPYYLEGVAAVGTVFAGAIYRLWQRVDHDHKITKVELQKCLDEHSLTKQEMSDIREELGFVRGRQDGIEDMSRNVLDTIARGNCARMSSVTSSNND